jgi:hypothetical protein
VATGRAGIRPLITPLMPRPIRRPGLILSLVLAVGACSYDPPIQTDHTAHKYQTDLQTCRDKAAHDVYMKFAGSIWTWIISPITAPSARHRAVRACMQSKGYVIQPD